jgi:hypothetical protein
MTLPKPHHPRDHADRFSECRWAMEDRMLELLGDAIEAGWTKRRGFGSRNA